MHRFGFGRSKSDNDKRSVHAEIIRLAVSLEKCCEAKDIVLGVNGEIYNYETLQKALEARGARGGSVARPSPGADDPPVCQSQARAPGKHRFLTKSDCEAR